MPQIKPQAHALLLIASILLVTGCATRGLVRREVAQAHQRVDQVAGQVEANQTRLVEHEERFEEQDGRLDTASETATAASQTAREALERALEAGKLAEGKLLYETVLSEDRVRFKFDTFELAEDSSTALDQFASNLKEANKDVFIEIQGHTDSTGSEDYNLRLGQERAETVRRYLNGQHALPLHRMSVISYGESAPIADNSERGGRSTNRRVALVVLK